MSDARLARPDSVRSFAVVTVAIGIVMFALGCSNGLGEIDVILTAQVPDSETGRSLRWSPKGEQLLLAQSSGGLTTNLRLGPDGTPALRELKKLRWTITSRKIVGRRGPGRRWPF